MSNIIEFKDGSMVENWLVQSMDLITEAHNEMIATHKLVEEIKDSSEGSLVDELIVGSNAVLNVANTLTGTMEEITSTVKDVVGKVSNFVTEAAGIVGKVFGMFG